MLKYKLFTIKKNKIMEKKQKYIAIVIDGESGRKLMLQAAKKGLCVKEYCKQVILKQIK